MGLETGEWRRCRSLSLTPPPHSVPTALDPAPLVTNSNHVVPGLMSVTPKVVLACLVTERISQSLNILFIVYSLCLSAHYKLDITHPHELKIVGVSVSLNLFFSALVESFCMNKRLYLASSTGFLYVCVCLIACVSCLPLGYICTGFDYCQPALSSETIAVGHCQRSSSSPTYTHFYNPLGPSNTQPITSHHLCQFHIDN